MKFFCQRIQGLSIFDLNGHTIFRATDRLYLRALKPKLEKKDSTKSKINLTIIPFCKILMS